jgi:hypothetical protein
MMPSTIFSYVKQEEARYETDEVLVGENWRWNMRQHIQLIFHLKNSIFYTGENNWLRSFKNIMEPMLNLAYWTEDIEVKDVVFYIESDNGRELSFLLKKYHDEVYVKEHDLDILFDEITESDLDYGGVLVQRAKDRPEVIPLSTVAFCDQTDILGGPIGFKHYFSPEKLRSMSKVGWGNVENGANVTLDELVVLADNEKDASGVQQTQENRVTGKVIEVYIVRGSLPEHYLKGNNNFDDYLYQLHIVAFYTDKKGNKHGVTLYKKRDDENNLRFHTSKKIEGRALGRGAGEALLHPQIWTNFLSIHKMKMLEAGAKVPLVTDDQDFTNRNVIQDMDNLEVTTIADGKRITQIPTAAVANIQLYEQSINEWFEQAQLSGAAFDPILGKEAVSGTTFRGQERTVAQGRGLHDRRRGQRAKFIEFLYRQFIIPDMIREITKGKEFLATLTTDELQWIAERLSNNFVERKIRDALFNFEIPQDKEFLKEMFLEDFNRGGNKRLLKIVKDEFRGVAIKMGINIAGKQKDLVNLSDKILSIFQFVFSNPQGFQQAMQVPALAKAFGDILEFSGMNQSDFASLVTAKPVSQAALPQPQEQLNLSQEREVAV